MKLALTSTFAFTLLVPAIAAACPYASRAGCVACSGSSWVGYGASLLLGLAVGFASVSFDRNRPRG